MKEFDNPLPITSFYEFVNFIQTAQTLMHLININK